MTELYSDATDSDAMAKRIQALERQVLALKTALTLENASVGAGGTRYIDGGGITIEDGGGIRILDNGDVVISGGTLRLIQADGETNLAYFGPSNVGNPLWRLNYPSGMIAIGILTGADPGIWTIRDNSDNEIMSNDAASRVGFARPYFNIPMYPSSGTSVGTGGPFWPEFVNSSFQEVMHGLTTLWHPKIAVSVNVNTASGTVPWELRIDGDLAGTGTDDDSGEFDVPGWGDTRLPGHQVSVQLHARNTSGTATRLIVDRCYGTQS